MTCTVRGSGTNIFSLLSQENIVRRQWNIRESGLQRREYNRNMLYANVRGKFLKVFEYFNNIFNILNIVILDYWQKHFCIFKSHFCVNIWTKICLCPHMLIMLLSGFNFVSWAYFVLRGMSSWHVSRFWLFFLFSFALVTLRVTQSGTVTRLFL